MDYHIYMLGTNANWHEGIRECFTYKAFLSCGAYIQNVDIIVITDYKNKICKVEIVVRSQGVCNFFVITVLCCYDMITFSKILTAGTP